MLALLNLSILTHSFISVYQHLLKPGRLGLLYICRTESFLLRESFCRCCVYRFSVMHLHSIISCSQGRQSCVRDHRCISVQNQCAVIRQRSLKFTVCSLHFHSQLLDDLNGLLMRHQRVLSLICGCRTGGARDTESDSLQQKHTHSQ